MRKQYILALVFLFLTTFCIEELIAPLNNAPTISSINLTLQVLKSTDTTEINCVARDNELDTLVYDWSTEFGAFTEQSLNDTIPEKIKWYPKDIGDGTYYVKLTVAEKKDLESKKDTMIRIQVHNNINDPVKPILLSPENGAEKVANNVVIEWLGVEVQNQTLKFDVFRSDGNEFITIDSNITINPVTKKYNYKFINLKYNTEYKWFVKAKYEITSTLSDTSSFTTRSIATGTLPSEINFVNVPAGEFKIYDPVTDTLTTKPNNVEFQIMKNEVTYKYYTDYLNEMIGNKNIYIEDELVKGFYDGDETLSADTNYVYFSIESDSVVSFVNESFTIKSGFENHPVTNVTWIGAKAFAMYYNLDLPSALQWEMAAKGQTGFNYTGSSSSDTDTLTFAMANMRDSLDFDGDGKKDTVLNMFGATTPVGFYNGANTISEHGKNITTVNYLSPYGAYDMAGNVMEWTSDISSISRKAAGGSFKVRAEVCKTWSFFNFALDKYGRAEDNISNQVGFRCIKK